MRYLTRIHNHSSILSLAGIVGLLALGGCSKNERPAESPSYSTRDSEMPGSGMSSENTNMQPASRELAPGEAAAARGPSSQSTEQTTPNAAEPTPEPLDDAKIAAITDAANSGEVEQAQVALTKSKNARVRKFAQMMIQHHGQAKKDGEKLATKLKLTPVESSTSGMLRQESSTLVSTLQGETTNFDETYIKSQVDGHQKVLDLFDQRLIPSATDPQLQAMLKGFRPKIEAHLKEAREIQNNLGASRPGSTQQSNVPGKQQTGTTTTTGQGSSNAPTHDHGQKGGAGH